MTNPSQDADAPRPFFVYWGEGPRRQLFAFRAQVEAATAADARRSVPQPRGARPRVFGVKLRGPDGRCGAAGRWVG